ncbi:hypothetical protein ACFYT4_08125 [Streptomyces sp. NPDC004609]|uniref:hypothetical protein n=1 Tax=Streptomyces sp. NPDC004609 TaxID=3364704 RepID=UPI0036CC8E51
MSKSVFRRVGVSLTAVAVMAGAAACQSGDGDGGGKKQAGEKVGGAGIQSTAEATKVLTAAYKKTSDAKSAKVSMTMTMPAGIEGGGDMEMYGVMGWDPAMADLTMKGSALTAASDAGGPEQIRMVWVDNVMYMDMGAVAAKEMDGKRWMTFDVTALAEGSGDKALQKQLTGSLESMNQSPAEQLAMLLESKSIKHVGPEKVGGVETQHYKGTLTVAEMLDANESLVLDAEQRKELLDGVKKAGVTGYDTEVWVNEDGFPVKLDVGISSPEGTVEVIANYSDYGTKAAVQAPPKKDTIDLMEMMKDMGQQPGRDGATTY